jgi:hypothetical protein
LLIGGEVFLKSCFDGIAAEMNELIRGKGVVSIGTIASRFGLPLDTTTAIVKSHIGSTIQATQKVGTHKVQMQMQMRGAIHA